MQDELLYKCHLLLDEDRALKAQPPHEVVVRVGRAETSQWPTMLFDPTLISMMYIAAKIP